MTKSSDENHPTEGNSSDGSAAEEHRGEEGRVGIDLGVEASEADPSDSGDRVSDALHDLELELAEVRDRHIRLAAEFENYRKRTRQELGQSGTRAQAELIGVLLDALDDFDRIVQLDEDATDAGTVLEGVRLVEKKLKRSLADAGVEMLDPTGEPFDPEVMEAVFRQPTEAEEDDDVVSQVFQKGVHLKGHLVRPARVAVWKLD
jgi:molecular chaperone GrpE